VLGVEALVVTAPRIRLAAFSLIVALLAVIASSPAHADKRVALVIGNGAYKFAPKLENPRVDARAMRDALSKLGFTVVYGEDLDKSSLEKRIGDFALAVRDADIAIAYFAGHGATFGDIPYIVPVDAQFEATEKIPYELVAVEALVGELRRAKGVRIAILDACRDNEMEAQLKRQDAEARGALRRGLAPTRGLAKVQNADGLIVAYATQYLTTALEGQAGGNSPFTGSLVHLIGTPNLDVKAMLFKVAQDVIAKTHGEQRPEISVSLFDEYALVPATAVNSEQPQPRDGITASALQAYDNYDLTGPDISVQANSDLKACLALCQAEPKCQAFSFNKWKKECALKSASGLLRFDARSVFGLPASSAVPAEANGEFKMETLPDTRLLGAAFKSTSASSFGRCSSTCQSDKDCVAFTYAAAEQSCKGFQSVDGYGPDQAAESGFKRQVARP